MFGRNRLSACLLAATVTLAGIHAGPALAAPAQVTTQVPGFYRQALGDYEVTALYDGYVDLHLQLMKGMTEDKLQKLVARMFLDHSKGVQTAVNAYLVHTGDSLILVDAGSAACFGPTLGNIVTNIKAAGYRPEDVDTVLLTHMHADHLCGLLDSQGKPAFAKAQVLAAQQDADFWLSEQIAAAAPKEAQGFFKMARDSVAPYQAEGRFNTFKTGESVVSGAQIVETHGHTPGHTSFLFQSQGKKLLVWGDIIHNHAVQFSHPDVSFEFDVDQKQAIKTRKTVIEQSVKNGWAIAGAHLPFPGLGHIRKEKSGYAWVPVEFGPIRKDR